VAETVALVAPAGASPNWDAAHAAIEQAGLGRADRLKADTWPQWEVTDPRGEWVTIEVLPILHSDVDALEEAFNTPPEGLSTISCDEGTLIHVFEEGQADVENVIDAADRLHDFGALRAAGLVRGTW